MKPRPPEFMRFGVEPIKANPETSTPKEEQIENRFNFLCFKALSEYPAGRDLLELLVEREILKPTFPAFPNVMEMFGGASNYSLYLEGRRSVIRLLQEGIRYYKSGSDIKTEADIIKDQRI